MQKKTRYIVVTGGVISGVGKGIISSSVGTLLEAQGYSVEVMKIDPYLNMDAGTMRPTEHGEVFVTRDGFETDQDLGNYYRFIKNYNPSRLNSITSGQIFSKVIKDERAGKYKGKCVEIFPHIPEEVTRRIYQVRDKSNPDFVLVEIGGTAGEDQQKFFYGAVGDMKYKDEEVRHIHVGYAPIPGKLGEQKSKPIQESVRRLNEANLMPDFIVGRSEKEIDDERKAKIAHNCKVRLEHIISAPDIDLVYDVPLLLRSQNLDINLLASMQMPYRKVNDNFLKWIELVNNIKKIRKKVKIAMIGKYFDSGNFVLSDSYISVIESLKIASWHNGFKPEIEWISSQRIENEASYINKLKEYDGICVPGGYGDKGVEGIIKAIKFARENKKPYLGLCFGMQLALVEFARDVCKLEGANTNENDKKTRYPIIDIMPDQRRNIGKKIGNSQRLGDYEARLKEGSLVWELYGKRESVQEIHRHRYEVNNKFVPKLEKKGIVVSGKNEERNLVEMVELERKKHPFFVATQAHPEFKSKFLEPAPLFYGFIKACVSNK